ncbi:MAG: FmdB family zinc ribbon protein [Bacillota bacterium]
MPIYEYKCDDCGKAFDMLMKMSERDKEMVCPDCGSKQVKKQFSTFGVSEKPGGSQPVPPCGGGCCGGQCGM